MGTRTFTKFKRLKFEGNCAVSFLDEKSQVKGEKNRGSKLLLLNFECSLLSIQNIERKKRSKQISRSTSLTLI